MKITLCGSNRFLDQFIEANRHLTLAGHIVYSLGLNGCRTESDVGKDESLPIITEDQKLMLDAVHLAKIDESDAIMVVGRQEDGTTYIGTSTRREMMYANLRDKHIYFFRPGEDPITDEELTAAFDYARTTDAERTARIAEAEANQRAFFEQLTSIETEDGAGQDPAPTTN